MKRTVIVPLLVASACARTASPAPQPPDCDLSVSFGSYAVGIDAPVLAAVRTILADPAVRSIEDRPWGREGEVTLCVRTRRAADADRLFGRIRTALPAKPRGPIGLRTASGLSFDSPPRR
jgi:hypothetical protein